MATLRSEDEQIEALKRWWKANGWSTVLGIVVALALYLGWQNWQARQLQYGAEASARYQQFLLMVQTLEQSPTDAQLAKASQWVENFKDEFGDTTYAQFAALLLARFQVIDGDLEGAEEQLSWVLDKRPDTATEHLTQLRLARVLFAQGDNDAAMAIAEQFEDSAFAAEFSELQGDISSEDGDLDAARDYYQRALNREAGGDGASYSAGNPMVQLKLDSLAVGEDAAAGQEG